MQKERVMGKTMGRKSEVNIMIEMWTVAETKTERSKGNGSVS